jgi:hydrogenase/urease accessory protein HupE
MLSFISFFLFFIFSSPAEAHILSGSASTFSAGLAHPFLGFDHLMAISAAGLWAAQKNKSIGSIFCDDYGGHVCGCYDWFCGP